MIEKKHTFLSANKMHNIHCVIWEPDDKKCLGVIQISHGMCEHIYRYREFAEFFTKQGFIVVGNDHAGHGESKKDLHGYMGNQKGYIYMVRDMHTLTKFLKKQYASLPIILLGHSMGSFLARIYGFYYSEDLKGIVISGTKGKVKFIKLGIYIADLFILIGLGKKKSMILNKLSFRKYNKKNKPCTTKYDWISSDHKIVDKYINDPLCTFTFTYYGYKDLFNMLRFIQTNNWYYNFPKNLPVYIFSGLDDPVGNYGKGVKDVYNRLKKAGLQDITVKLYEGGRHEMLNETNSEEVFFNILDWITERL